MIAKIELAHSLQKEEPLSCQSETSPPAYLSAKPQSLGASTSTATSEANQRAQSNAGEPASDLSSRGGHR